MSMRPMTLWMAALCGFLWVPTVSAQVLTEADAVALALAENGGLAAKVARARGMAETAPQAGAWPDPMVSFTAMNLPVDGLSPDQEPMTQLQVGVKQTLPFFGKRGLGVRAAAHAAHAADAAAAEAGLSLAAAVKQAWWGLLETERALTVVLRNQQLLRQFVDIARTKYKVGKGLQQEVLLAEVELSKLLDGELRLEGRRARQVAHLNALIGRPVGTPVVLPETVLEDLEELAPVADLLALAATGRPALDGAGARVEAARAHLELARRAHLPDVSVGAAYGLRQGDNADGSSRADFVTLGVSLSLPLHRDARQHRQVAMAEDGFEAAQAEYRDMLLSIQAQVAGAHAGYEQARLQAGLFRDGIVPQATQTVASMLAGYQVGKVDFLNLVQAEITLYRYQVRYWEAVAAAHGARAALESAVGGELPGGGA